ncbi:MAG: prepilin peptidase [Lachnospiraceae bacterium]|nr:prepilin peptidase [Lachnospiraceae bacterium]
MTVAMEVLFSLALLAAGYVGTCQYLKNGAFRPFAPGCMKIRGKNRIAYLGAGVLANGCLLVLFQTLYMQTGLLHQLKLLALINLMFPVAAVDYETHKIPNAFLLTALGIRVCFGVGEMCLSMPAVFEIWKDGIIGAAVVGCFFLLILLLFRNSIGMGDIKLFMVMGLYQGLWGVLNSVFFSLMVSFVLSVGLLLSRKKKRKDTISFGPSVLAGTVLAVCLAGM